MFSDQQTHEQTIVKKIAEAKYVRTLLPNTVRSPSSLQDNPYIISDDTMKAICLVRGPSHNYLALLFRSPLNCSPSAASETLLGKVGTLFNVPVCLAMGLP